MSAVELTKGEARATIALAGAEARSWSVEGRNLLWPGDPAIWADISPILYPVVGWTRDGARVGGRHYPLGLHGFARFETFAVEAARRRTSSGSSLRDNERTSAVYPFAFTLAVEYRLERRGARHGDRSRKPRPLRPPLTPAACIPGFRWPLGESGRDGAFVRFEKPERGEVPADRAGRPHRRCDEAGPAHRPRPAAQRRAFRQRRGLLPRLQQPFTRLP